jgi:hypothetical protein
MLETPKPESTPIDEKLIPLGQKCVKAGFKKITENDLKKRFYCDDITKREIDKAVERLAARHKGDVKHIQVVESQYSYARYNRGPNPRDIERVTTCFIMYNSLESYMGSILSDKCLRSVEKAKKTGLTNFKVMHTNYSEQDPIVVGILPDESMIEIDLEE